MTEALVVPDLEGRGTPTAHLQVLVTWIYMPNGCRLKKEPGELSAVFEFTTLLYVGRALSLGPLAQSAR